MTVDMQLQNLSLSPDLGTKIQKEVPLFLEIPSNTL